MAVGKQGSSSVTVSYDDAPGGSPQLIGGFIMEMGGAEIEVETATSDSFGDSWREHTPTGMRNVPDIPVSGHFDTTATTGPHVVLRVVDGDASPQASTRSLIIVFGDSKTFTLETRLAKYKVTAVEGQLTKFEAVIRPTGAAVWS